MKKPQYVAFISYSHADNLASGRCWANWLHKSLETYVVPPELVGSKNLDGTPVPERLFPVFRDEEEFSAEAGLTSAIHDALTRSRTLIVLCSPRSARSDYVAAEIRFFQSLGRADSIITVLIDGGPGQSHPAGEAFPEPLRSSHTANTEDSAEPLAADFRLPDSSQGFTDPKLYQLHLRSLPGVSPDQHDRLTAVYRERHRLAFLKIVAAVLAIPLAALTRRDQAYQLTLARRRARIFRTVATALSILLGIAILSGLYANRKRVEAVKARDSANDLVNFMLTDLHDQLAETGRLDVLSSAVEKIEQHLSANPAPRDLEADLRLQQARIDFGSGHLEKAISRVNNSLKNDTPGAVTPAHQARLHAFLGDVLAWKHGGNEAAKQECLTALSLFDASTKDGTSLEAQARTLVALGDILRDEYQTTEALKTYEEAWTLAAVHAPLLDQIRVLARQRHAEVCHLQNEPLAAIASLQAAFDIIRQHLEDTPNSHPWIARRAQTLILRSTLEFYSGQSTLSLNTLREAEADAQQVATPGQLHYLFLLATIRSHIAAHPSPMLTLQQRSALFQDSIRTQRSLLKEAPGNRDWAARLASTLRDHADFENQLGDLFKDETYARHSLEELQEAEILLRPIDLPGQLRERVETLISLSAIVDTSQKSSFLASAGTLLARLPQNEVETLLLRAFYLLASQEDKTSLAQSHELIEHAWKQARGMRKDNLTEHLADSHQRLAALAASAGNKTVCLEHSDRSIALRRELIKSDHDQPDQLEKLALALNTHARTLRDLDAINDAQITYQEAADLFSSLSKKYPDHAPPFRELALAQYQMGKIASSSSKQENALMLFQSACENFHTFLLKASLEQPRKPMPMSAANLRTLAAITGKQADAATASGKAESAATAWGSLLILMQEALNNSPASESEAADVISLQLQVITSAFTAYSALDRWPRDQDEVVRLILNQLPKLAPEAASSPEFQRLRDQQELAR